jgi:hypothetical protein
VNNILNNLFFVEGIRQNRKTASAKENDIRAIIMDWFRFATSRNKEREQRRLKVQQGPANNN